MAIPENDETYLDRLLTSEQAAGLPHILNLDPDVNVRTIDQRYLQDAYNYYLGGGRDAAQADFPIQASGITTQVPATTVPGTGEGGTGITATGVATPIAPTVEQTAAMEDIGATTTMKDILDDARTQQLRPASTIPTDYEAEAYGAPDTIESLTAATRMPTDYEAEAYGAPDTIASLQDVTPEAQGAWQKVQSGLASVGDFIQNYGMATYNFLAGNIGAGVMGLATGPLGLGLTAGLGALGLETTPEQKAMMSAAQASGIADPNDPRKDIHGTNIVSALGDYDQSVADSIATIEETARKKGGEDKLAPNLQKKLADYRNYQNEKAWEDVDTDIAEGEIGSTLAPVITHPTYTGEGRQVTPKTTDTAEIPAGWLEHPEMKRGLAAGEYATTGVAKGALTLDEATGKYFDAAGNVVEDPRKAEVDIALASDPVTTKLETQKQKIESLKKSDAWEFLSKEQKEQKEKELEKINNQLKKAPKVKDISLVDLTDTGRDDIIDRPTVEDVAATEDINITPTTTFTPRGGGADRDPAPTTTTFTPRGGGADRDPAPSRPSGPSPGVPAGAGPPSVSGGGGAGCFVKGTPITMADGSTKPVEQVDLGDKVAEGGKVFAAGRFLTEELHDYEGIKVSGSHMVNEDGTWVRVRDSEKGKPLGDDEHTVYVFGAEHRRILINGILFTDYFELPEQEQLDKNGDTFFINWKEYAEKANDQVVKILNAS